MSGERADAAAIAVVLLDVEGTTTPIAFVTQVLFPYARTHLRSYLERHAASADHERLVARLHDEHAAASRDADAPSRWIDEPIAARVASIAAFVEWLMDRDRKSTALKELQGRIWESGYQRGEIAGEVFPDVPRALRRWRDRGVAVAIFSSGSVLAQQLLFRHSTAGDLTSLIRWHFDTAIGTKGDPDSYRRIAAEVGCAARTVLFVSDVVRELDAARAAAMNVRLSIRPGNAAPPDSHGYEAIRTFDQLEID